jgi:decaprenyl-phosphate phosphoribosyltransferase
MATPVVTLPARPTTSPARAVVDLVRLARPGQWAKNILVIPLAVLDAPVWRLGMIGQILWAIAAFTLGSAVIYVINDIADRERDRRHAVKRLRPIAAGRISLGVAWAYAAVLVVGLAALLVGRPIAAWWPIPVYLALNFAYSYRLKHAPLIDVLVVAAGFVLRLWQGHLAIGATHSDWLMITVFSVCVLLSLGKRRHELVVSGAQHRPALRGYSVQLADHLILLTSALTIASYLFFISTLASVGSLAGLATLISTPCAFLALFRYLQTVMVDEGGGNPVRVLLRDRTMLANSLVWLAVLSAVLITAHA